MNKSRLSDMDVAQEVDAKQLRCPLPILRAKKALSTMQSGEVLRVLTTDPHARQDFAVFCNQTQQELLAQYEHEGVMEHYLKKR